MAETVQPQQIQEPVSVDDNSGSLTVDNAGLTELAGAIDTEMQVDVVGALPAGTNAIGKLAANSGVDIGDVDVTSIAAGDNNIGNVDIVTVPAPLSTTGGGTEAAALRVTVATDSTGVLSVDDNGGALTVDQGTAANLNMTEASAASIKTAVEIMDDWDESDRAKVNPIAGQAGVAGNTGTVGATTQRVTLATDVALPAGTNLLGATTPRPETANGLSIFRSLDLDETEEAVKATAGQVYGWFIANTATTTRFVKFYDDTVANVVVGSTTPVITFGIPGNTSDDIAANALGAMGITFANAITVAATTGVADADTGAPAANDVIINVFYK